MEKERKEIEAEDPEVEDEEIFSIEVAPVEFLITLEDVSRIISQNKGTIKGIRC